MHRNEMRGHWNQLREEAGSIWANLTDDDLDYIQGDAEKLVERVQNRYGYDRIVAQHQVNRFLERYSSIMLAMDAWRN
jgi:uncharacterized protein YjbJ (UPF0337 family)